MTAWEQFKQGWREAPPAWQMILDALPVATVMCLVNDFSTWTLAPKILLIAASGLLAKLLLRQVGWPWRP